MLAVSFGLAALERQLAIRLLGAEVPPMLPAPAPAEVGVWRRLRAFLANPVTWKGMGYLAIKFPLGLASFVLLVVSLAVAGALLATPFAYRWVPIYFLDRPVTQALWERAEPTALLPRALEVRIDVCPSIPVFGEQPEPGSDRWIEPGPIAAQRKWIG